MFYHVITHNAAAAESLGPLPKYADKEDNCFIWRCGHWTVSDKVLEPQVAGKPTTVSEGVLLMKLLDVDALAIAKCITAAQRFRRWYYFRKAGDSEQIKIVRLEDRLCFKYSCIADAIPEHAYFEHNLEFALNQTTTDESELYLCHMLTR